MAKKPTKWAVSKPRKSYASGELMYRVEGPDVVGDYEDWGYTEGHAKLMAAAPELLEALRLADAALSGANMDVKVIARKVHAALAKAA